MAGQEHIYRMPGDFGWRKSIPLQLLISREIVKDLGISDSDARRLNRLHEQIEAEVKVERRKVGG